MKRVVLLAAALMLGGCVTHTVSTIDIPGEDRITPEDRVNCALVPDIGDRPENLHTSNAYYTTGPIWRRVFVGDASAPATLRIVSTELSENMAVPGVTLRDTYVIDAELTFAGTTHPIHATGSRAAGMNHESARRQAVELGVVDMARQVREIMTNHPR